MSGVVRRLCDSVSDRVRSYQVATLSDAVVCLVQNSIDASARSIQLFVSAALDVEIVDDGNGLSVAELGTFGTATTSSVGSSVGCDDSLALRRGESLSSIVALSEEYVFCAVSICATTLQFGDARVGCSSIIGRFLSVCDVTE